MMAEPEPLKIGDHVRLGKGRKVYQVTAIAVVRGETLHNIDATADHPDAATRVQDAFASYTRDQLTKLRRR